MKLTATHPAWLLVILAAALALRIAFAALISGNDDMVLAGDAIDILEKGMHLPLDHYSARFGLSLPLALVFRLLGVGLPQLVVIPMAVSLAGIFIAWRLGTLLFEPVVGLAAAAVLALYPLDAEYAGLFFPDLVQGVLLAGSFLLALHSTSSRHGAIWTAGSGICWAWAYYVKIDAFFMGFVFLLATCLGLLPWRRLLLLAVVALALVGIELVTYAARMGSPFYHVALERMSANEMLAPGWDYRNLLTYPKAMFVTLYETGLTFYLFAGAVLLAFVRRQRPAIMLAGWALIFLFWLTFGMDPFGHTLRLKPQLPRYLLDFAVPMAVLTGWFLIWAYRRVSRPFTLTVSLAGAGVAILFMQFNVLNYEAANATRIATATALRENWFPLYPDQQSINTVEFILHDLPQRAEVHMVQQHDFLTGRTTFLPISGRIAYLLINDDTTRQLAARNLVTPVNPAQFGMTATEILSVDNPMPGFAYGVLRGLADLAGLLPLPSLRAHISDTAHDVLLPGDAKIYRLTRTSS